MNILSIDQSKRILEILKQDAKYVKGQPQLRKSFYLSPCGNWISFNKKQGYSYHKTSEVLAQLKSSIKL